MGIWAYHFGPVLSPYRGGIPMPRSAKYLESMAWNTQKSLKIYSAAELHKLCERMTQIEILMSNGISIFGFTQRPRT